MIWIMSLGFKEPPSHTVTKKMTTSSTDPECGYIHHRSKRGVGYLMEATVDCKHGIVTGVDVFPVNEEESLLVLRHLERQQNQLGLSMEKVALDRGHDTGAVHRGWNYWELPDIFPSSVFPTPPVNMDFHMIHNSIHLLPNGTTSCISPSELQ